MSSLKTNTDILLITIIICVVVGLEIWYMETTVTDLIFVLKPVSWLIELFTGHNSVYVANTGYYFQEVDVLIEKSCSGVHFLIITFTLMSIMFLKHYKSIFSKISYVLSIAGLSAFIGLFTNANRITIAIFSLKFQYITPIVTKPYIHEAIGVFVFLLYLSGFYLLVKYIHSEKRISIIEKQP